MAGREAGGGQRRLRLAAAGLSRMKTGRPSGMYTFVARLR